MAIAQALEGIGATSIAAGDGIAGVTLIHAGLAARENAGTPLADGEHFDVDRALGAATDLVSSADVAAAAKRGQALDLAAAMDLAGG